MKSLHNFKKVIQQAGLLTVTLTVALAANLAYGQWTNPPSSPPNGNVAAPVNVGPGAQTKTGFMSFAGGVNLTERLMVLDADPNIYLRDLESDNQNPEYVMQVSEDSYKILGKRHGVAGEENFRDVVRHKKFGSDGIYSEFFQDLKVTDFTPSITFIDRSTLSGSNGRDMELRVDNNVAAFEFEDVGGGSPERVLTLNSNNPNYLELNGSNGQMRAARYCDESGGNCISTRAFFEEDSRLVVSRRFNYVPSSGVSRDGRRGVWNDEVFETDRNSQVRASNFRESCWWDQSESHPTASDSNAVRGVSQQERFDYCAEMMCKYHPQSNLGTSFVGTHAFHCGDGYSNCAQGRFTVNCQYLY